MLKKFIVAVFAVAASTGLAQAAITPINSTFNSSNINKIDTYFIRANATGNVDIFLQSQFNTELGFDLPIDLTLTVWQQVGNLWSLIGANAGAARTLADSGKTTIYGQTVLQWTGGFDGMADPGLSLSLTSGNTYMIVNSEENNGPTSLAKASSNLYPTTTNEWGFTGALGQTIAVSSTSPGDYSSAFQGLNDLSGSGVAYSINTPYVLTINGNVSLVPLPAAVWLFATALAGFGVFGKRKTYAE
ncbi:MAG: VPLPA-CTERM sorting domain-containing protein [Methylococcales bacterium]|nr:VPLPA-CTERM sorting domain-containing protein [Methylococcales bacterium]